MQNQLSESLTVLSKTSKRKYNTKFNKVKKEISQNGILYIFSLPGLIFLLMFSYIPMAGLVMVFKDYNYKDGIFGSPWVGFKNFEYFFYSANKALRATYNTVLLNILFITLGTIVAVAIAVMLNETKNKAFRNLSQSVIFFPYFISWAVMGAILNTVFNEQHGLINNILNSFGLHPVEWYSNATYWVPILVICSIWKGAGYSSIIYFSVLTGFDPVYYEAATVDGATKLQQIIKLTIPMLKPTIIILFLLSIGRILYGDLSMITGTTNLNPLLLPTTDIIDTYVYRSVIKAGEFGFTSAIALYQSVFGLILVLLANWIAGLYDRDYRLF